MTTPVEARVRLDDHALELNTLSRALAEVQRQLEPVEVDYQTFVDDYEVGLYLKSEEDGGRRLPAQAMQLKLARREMAPELLGRRDGLIRKRDRISKRIDDLTRICRAEISVLSALKTEVEATA